MITEQDYKNAQDIIIKYKKQIEEENRQEFRKSLEKYDRTHWFYKGRLGTTFVLFIASDYGYNVTKFIEHSNGIIEITSTTKERGDIEHYLMTMEEFAPTDYDLEYGDKKFIFKFMKEEEFILEVQKLLDKIKLSKNKQLTLQVKG